MPTRWVGSGWVAVRWNRMQCTMVAWWDCLVSTSPSGEILLGRSCEVSPLGGVGLPFGGPCFACRWLAGAGLIDKVAEEVATLGPWRELSLFLPELFSRERRKMGAPRHWEWQWRHSETRCDVDVGRTRAKKHERFEALASFERASKPFAQQVRRF